MSARVARVVALLGIVIAAVGTAPSARGEEARPGRTLVLHHGSDPRVASAMPGGPSRDGRLRFALPRQAPTARVVVPMPGARPRGPAIDAEGRIFVGTTTGVTLIAADGSSTREVSVGALDSAPVLVPGGDLIALSREGMFARIAPDGSVRARAATGLAVRFAPLVGDDGGLAVVAASRTLARVGSDLEVRASCELPDGLALSPTRTAHDRWAIAAGAELVLVDPESLEILRSIALPGRAATPAAASPDGSIWVATVEGQLVRVRGARRIGMTVGLGARLPEATTSDRAMLGVAPDGDVLVVVPARGLVRIAADGSERWTWSSDTPLVGAISVDESGCAAVLDRIGHLSVIDRGGVVLWTLPLEGLPLGAAIATAQGRVVVATERGVVILGPG